MTSPRKLTPQEEARLAQARENFKNRKKITDSLTSISKRIGVYSGKGGVGKTTITTNLAVTLSEKNQSVAIDTYSTNVAPTTINIMSTLYPGINIYNITF